MRARTITYFACHYNFDSLRSEQLCYGSTNQRWSIALKTVSVSDLAKGANKNISADNSFQVCTCPGESLMYHLK